MRAELDRYLATVERVDDPAIDEKLEAIMTRLLKSAGYPALDIDVWVLNSEEIAAYATPCRQILLTKGMLDWQASLGEQNASSGKVDPIALAEAYTASMLAHELAHVTLGHAAELVQRPLGLLQDLTGEAPAPATLDLGMDRGLMDEAQRSQEREFEADRLGALYLLRSGWEIQHAMDTYRGLDALARADPDGCFYCLEATTYLSSHPRSSDREAAVESFRANLKRLQAAFDDARTLILHNAELDHAIALLDEVLTAFPDLLPAKHARAVALQTKWVNGLAVQELRVQMSLPLYEARFLTGLRGAAALPNLELMEAARRAYHEVLLHEQMPYALSNLAVLDAYGGYSGSAIHWARQAVEMAPNDAQVLNNLGVVLYLNGELPSAAEAFERAVAASSDKGSSPALFNQGRALAELDEEVGRELLIRYVRQDPFSAWSREAMRLAGVAPRGEAPALDVPQLAVAGMRLGDSPQAVEAALGGRPVDVQRLIGGPVSAWIYESQGLHVYMHDASGVTALIVTKPRVTTVMGAEVAAPVDSFLREAEKAGLAISLVPSAGDDEVWVVSPGSGWQVSVEARNRTIASICLRRVLPASQRF
jgi:predicted Zn-dependent protease